MFGCIKLLLNGTPIREIKEQLHWANQAAGASGRLCKQFTGNNPLVIKLEEWGRFLIIILTLAVVVFFHAARRLHYPLSPSLWLQSASNPEGAVKWEETGLTIRQQIRTPTLKSFFPQLQVLEPLRNSASSSAKREWHSMGPGQLTGLL